LRGFCQFWSKYYHGSSCLTSPDPSDREFWERNKVFWRAKVNRVWKYFITKIILWKWAIIFYDLDLATEEEVDTQISLFLKKPEVQELIDLQKIVENLRRDKVVKVDLGIQKFKEEKSLFLTIEKDFVFGIEGKTRDYSAANFLLTLKKWKLKIREDQLIRRLQNWFFDKYADSENQLEWIWSTFIKVREDSLKLLQLEKKHPFGLLFRDWKSKFTPAALTLTILCNEAQHYKWQDTPEDEEFSFQVLAKIYELQKLADEGRTFWDNWKFSLIEHISTILPAIIFYSRRKRVPVAPENWLSLLMPLKEKYFNFLFWISENAKKEVLELLKQEINSLIKYKYLGPGGEVNQKRLREQSSNPFVGWMGMKRGLRSLAKEISW
jgi:hypothetical protein